MLLLLVTLAGEAHAACLSGLPPLAPPPAAAELLGLLRREGAASRTLGALARQQVVEHQGRYLRHLRDDRRPGFHGRCASQWRARTRAALMRAGGVVFSRETVARIRALRHDPISGDADTRALLRTILAAPRDGVRPYAPLPEERGPLPPPSWLRALAARAYAGPGTQAAPGTPDHALLARRSLESDDPIELLALQGTLGGPLPEETVVAWVDDVAVRLQGAPSPAAVDLVIARLYAVAGERSARNAAFGLARAIVARDAAFPLVAGDDAARSDLHRAARTVLSAEAHPSPERFLARERIVERRPVDLDRLLLDDEPAGGVVPGVDAARRLRWLDEALPLARGTHARCAILREIPRWLSADEAEARWTALTEPLWALDAPTGAYETVCRIEALTALETVSVARRATAVTRVLDTPIGPRPPPRPGMVRGPAGLAGARAAAEALRENPGWVTTDPALRAWLEARMPTDASSEDDHLRLLETALLASAHPLVAFHLSEAPDADPAMATALLRRWLARLDGLLVTPSITSLADIEEIALHLAALERWADAAGVPEADERFARVAAPDWHLGTRVNPSVEADLRRQAWVALRRPPP